MKKIAIVFAIAMFIWLEASTSYAQFDVSVSVQIAPPELPLYSQPLCPGDGYMWIPGYWAYGNDGYYEDDYYWVPGVWVYPPSPGFYWTPSYWAYSGGYYGWHPGYWGEYVGFYGGVNYGYGYGGVGFGGGRWEGNSFRYNAAVMNVNTTVIHNTYVDNSVRYSNNNRASFNGPGGISAQPTMGEQRAMRDRHVIPTAEQSSHQMNARNDRDQFVSVNHGRPSKVSMNSVQGTRFNPEGTVYKNSTEGHPASDRSRKPDNRFENPNPGSTTHTDNPARNERPAKHPRTNPSEEQNRVPRQQQANPSERPGNAPRQQQANPSRQNNAPRQQASPSQRRESPRPSRPSREKKN